MYIGNNVAPPKRFTLTAIMFPGLDMHEYSRVGKYMTICDKKHFTLSFPPNVYFHILVTLSIFSTKRKINVV